MASFKNRLQEFFQKRHLDLPKYETADQGGVFACKILLSDGKSIISSEFPNKKSAEQDAAAKALQYIEQNESRFSTPQRSLPPMLGALHNMNPMPPRESSPLSEISYKNLSQEFMQSRSLGTPKYSTQATGPSHTAVFLCELQIPPHPSFGNLKFFSSTYYNAKTKAEQDAARQACIYFNIIKPEFSTPDSQSIPISQPTSPPQASRPFTQFAKLQSGGGPSPNAPEFRPSVPIPANLLGTGTSSVPIPATLLGFGTPVSQSLVSAFNQQPYPTAVSQPTYSLPPGPKDRIHDEGRLHTRRFLENVMKKYKPSELEFTTFTKDFPPNGRYFGAKVHSAYHNRTIRSQDYHITPEAAEDDAAECVLVMMELMEFPERRSVLAAPDYGRPRVMQESQQKGPSQYESEQSSPMQNSAEARGSFPGPTVLPTSMSDIEPELSALISNIKKIHFPPPAPRPRHPNFESADDNPDQPLFVEQDQ